MITDYDMSLSTTFIATLYAKGVLIRNSLETNFTAVALHCH